MRMPDGQTIPLKVRSLVGLLPMCAATVFDGDLIEHHPEVLERLDGVRRALLRCAAAAGAASRSQPRGPAHRLARSTSERLRRILAIMLDEDEFLGPHGIRAISRRHLDDPFVFDWGGQQYKVQLPPGRVRHRHVRRQLQLARPGLVPDEPGDHARPVSAAPLLRRPAQGRVPDRLRPAR